MQRQLVAAIDWVSTNSCDELSNIIQPTLIIVGTEDAFTPAANSLITAEKIPGAWNHGLMYQYPDTFSSMASTFLETAD